MPVDKPVSAFEFGTAQDETSVPGKDPLNIKYLGAVAVISVPFRQFRKVFICGRTIIATFNFVEGKRGSDLPRGKDQSGTQVQQHCICHTDSVCTSVIPRIDHQFFLLAVARESPAHLCCWFQRKSYKK